jgi:hypothetical protein
MLLNLPYSSLLIYIRHLTIGIGLAFDEIIITIQHCPMSGHIRTIHLFHQPIQEDLILREWPETSPI